MACKHEFRFNRICEEYYCIFCLETYEDKEDLENTSD